MLQQVDWAPFLTEQAPNAGAGTLALPARMADRSSTDSQLWRFDGTRWKRIRPLAVWSRTTRGCTWWGWSCRLCTNYGFPDRALAALAYTAALRHLRHAHGSLYPVYTDHITD